MASRSKLSYLTRLFRDASMVQTIRVNFTALPFKQAVKLPILVGRRVAFKGLRKDSLRFAEPEKISLFCVRLAVTNDYPIFPNKREHSMYRCAKNASMVFSPGEINIYCGFSIVNSGLIEIGGDVIINQHSTIICSECVSIGSHCGIGWNVQIMDTDLHVSYNIENGRIYNPSRPVSIGSNVWIGSNASIMKGARIPDMSTVASCSVFLRTNEEVTTVGNLFAGSPASLIRTGAVRIMNRKKESEMLAFFRQSGSDYLVTTDDFDYTQYLSRK